MKRRMDKRLWIISGGTRTRKCRVSYWCGQESWSVTNNDWWRVIRIWWVDNSKITGIRGGVIGGAGVYDCVSEHRGSQSHNVEGVGQFLLIPSARSGWLGMSHSLLLVRWGCRQGREQKSVGGTVVPWLSHPKFFVSECEPFSQKILKFSKGFHLFSFKMILFEFIFNLKWVYKVKRFIWCSKFILLNCE
jgi:hypothetical protein